jgi:hypothetical protein
MSQKKQAEVSPLMDVLRVIINIVIVLQVVTVMMCLDVN